MYLYMYIHVCIYACRLSLSDHFAGAKARSNQHLEMCQAPVDEDISMKHSPRSDPHDRLEERQSIYVCVYVYACIHRYILHLCIYTCINISEVP